MPDQPPQPDRPRVLSGMRPTGRLHLGNYMGALYNWVNLQDQRDAAGNPTYDCFFFIADWHALTTDYADPSRLKQNVFEIALDFLAAGLDPDRSTIFIQSHVPQHAELHLLLSMITPVSWLERVPTYKDQQEQLREKDLATYGFLGYPLLQSADILLYRPHFVPVGADQVAHVEITREVARRFNHLYQTNTPSDIQKGWQAQEDPAEHARLQTQTLLPEPQVLLTPSPKLPGTDGRKMSKSYNNSILLTDSRVLILEKMHGMTNGGQRPTLNDPGNPEICPVGDLHRVFSKSYVDQHIRTGCRTATIACEKCKQLAGLSIFEHVGPIQTRREELENDPDQVWDALDRGRDRADAACNVTMTHLREVTGLSRDRSGVRLDRNILNRTPKTNPRDLSGFAAWWNLEPHLLSRNLQELWLKTIPPTGVDLKPSGDGIWITRDNRRVLAAAAAESTPDLWTFTAKPKSYEIVVLLCWQSDLKLVDFVLPQKLYVAPWAAAKKFAGKSDLVFSVTRAGGTVELCLPGAEPIDLTGTQANYKIMGG